MGVGDPVSLPLAGLFQPVRPLGHGEHFYYIDLRRDGLESVRGKEPGVGPAPFPVFRTDIMAIETRANDRVGSSWIRGIPRLYREEERLGCGGLPVFRFPETASCPAVFHFPFSFCLYGLHLKNPSFLHIVLNPTELVLQY